MSGDTVGRITFGPPSERVQIVCQGVTTYAYHAKDGWRCWRCGRKVKVTW